MKIICLVLCIMLAPFIGAQESTQKSSLKKDTLHKDVTHNSNEKPNYMGTHGMVLIKGSNNELIASHLPLYHSPHDYQIIYQIDASNPQLNQLTFGSAEQDKLITDNLKTDDLITILPKPFDLMRLVNKQQVEITADVYQGHFERGGTKLFQTNIRFKQPLFIRKISAPRSGNQSTATIAQETIAQETFKKITINSKQELWIHLIERQPSFDAFVLRKNVASDDKELSAQLTSDDTLMCEGKNPITKQNILKLVTSCFTQAPSLIDHSYIEHTYIEISDFK